MVQLPVANVGNVPNSCVVIPTQPFIAPDEWDADVGNRRSEGRVHLLNVSLPFWLASLGDRVFTTPEDVICEQVYQPKVLCYELKTGRNSQSGVLLANSYTRSGQMDRKWGWGCTGTPSQRLGTCVPPAFHVKFLARTFSGARRDFHRVKRGDFRPESG